MESSEALAKLRSDLEAIKALDRLCVVLHRGYGHRIDTLCDWRETGDSRRLVLCVILDAVVPCRAGHDFAMVDRQGRHWVSVASQFAMTLEDVRRGGRGLLDWFVRVRLEELKSLAAEAVREADTPAVVPAKEPG